MDKPKIVYVSHSLANRFDGYIEINKNLKKYPSLYNTIISHELSHSSNQGFTKQDFLLDQEKLNINYWDLFKFMAKHPLSFAQFLPFYIGNGVFIYDTNKCIVWLTALGVLTLAIYFGLS
jgi:hypothetical protein